MTIDFRSDTVTKPTPAMLQAMQQAKVGDDVFGEDESINALENFAAQLFGMQAAVFCPSGTMTNQIAIKVHTQPGDEVICERMSHVYQYEGGGIAFNSGCSVNLIDGDRGRINAAQVLQAINANDVHKANSSLVCLENTSNRGGGSCYNFEDITAIKKVCTDNNLALHLDGARLFNALIAQQQTAKQYGETFNSISICLSKGLGAPVGSVLLGTKPFIAKARRIRKVFGGGMRQAGFMAAAGLYALQHHIERLSVDHHHAKLIEQTLQTLPYVDEIKPVETNIIIFSCKGKYTSKQLVEVLKQKQILAYAISPTQVRLVVHLDVSEAMIERTIEVLKEL